jgi:7-cyano-7-deazaguanine synthase in queuosine biosynthesis
MGMTHFQLRTRRNQVALPAPTVLLDWTGGGSTIQRRHSLTTDLSPPAAAIDFLRFAGAVYCVDKLAARPGTWGRSLSLDIPVRDIERWTAAAPVVAEALSFLSGDQWKLDLRPDSAPTTEAAPLASDVDAVCLFSGGLDSFTGAVDLLAEGRRVCLVAHYEGGQAPKTQEHLFRVLRRTYGRDRLVLRQIFLRPAPPSNLQTRPLPDARESTTRTRSILFLAAGLVVASGYGPDVPLLIPENGFIGINVPLTRARTGSLSTRTTHPYFMEQFERSIRALGLTNPIVNPYRTMTKGEMLANSPDRNTLFAHAPTTLSCAHPEAPRYAKRQQGNCGYCFPCLIRRASMHHVNLDDPNDYAFDVLNEATEMEQDRGADLRALIRSLNHAADPLDVLRNGPVRPEDLTAFAGVYARGRSEILTWLRATTTAARLRRQLPAS